MSRPVPGNKVNTTRRPSPGQTGHTGIAVGRFHGAERKFTVTKHRYFSDDAYSQYFSPLEMELEDHKGNTWTLSIEEFRTNYTVTKGAW